MINLKLLERKWLFYKIKIYLPYAILITLLVLILFILSIFLTPQTDSVTSEKERKNRQHHEKTLVKHSPKKQIVAAQKKVTKKIPPKQKVIEQPTKALNTPVEKKESVKKILLHPSLNFLKSLDKNSTQESEKTALPATRVLPTPKNVLPTPQKIKEKEEKTAAVTAEEKEHKSSSIVITKRNTHKDIQDVIRRFNKNNNPALSLFIAKKYYNLGLYTKSYNYALITNKLDKNIEASWIIFAKSLVKLHKREMALKILKQYIEYSNSQQANMLLNEIKSGKFQ